MGCERLRFLIRQSRTTDLRLHEVVLETEGCPPGQYKNMATRLCTNYTPGFWCATETRCQTNDPCGGASFYCTGDGLRHEVRPA